MASTPRDYAHKLLRTLERDRDEVLLRIDDYLRGNHDDPYMPDLADAEYKMLAKRAVSNWIPLLVSTPAQAMYVDNFRRPDSDEETDPTATTPEWEHWQRSRLDARQNAIHRGAIAYGHSFTLTYKNRTGQVITKGLSPLRTSAIFEDAANDDTPIAALTVTSWPDSSGDDPQRGRATMWIGDKQFAVSFKSMDDRDSIVVTTARKHGAKECPVTRFVAYVDLDGRTTGVVEPVIPLQNRINQTVFDLLVAQTFGSFKVRTVTGMAPPMRTQPVYEIEGDPTSPIIDTEPVLDSRGQPVPENIDLTARRFLFAEDHEVRFGTLDETPLGGYIESIDMSIRHLSAVSQTPPQHLLGQIANLSAEALQAAETSLSRMVEGFRKSFGESWERVFRLAAELAGDKAAADDHAGEVIWRDMELRSLAQSADGLSKLKEGLGIPARGLWKRVPGVTRGELQDWERISQEDDPELALAGAIDRATPTFQIPEVTDGDGA